MESPIFTVGDSVVVIDQRGWKGIQYHGPFNVTSISKKPKAIRTNSARYPKWPWSGYLPQCSLVASTPALLDTIHLQQCWYSLLHLCEDLTRIATPPIGSISDITSAINAIKKVLPPLPPP